MSHEPFEIPKSHTSGKVLVVVPNDPLDAYKSAGYQDLTDYFNPLGFFDKVFCMTPWEQDVYEKYGMTVVPLYAEATSDAYQAFLKQENVSIIRAYDFRAAHGIIQFMDIPEDIPFLVSVHDDRTERFREVPATKYIAISQSVKRMLLENGVASEKIEVMSNRVDTNFFRRIGHCGDIPREIIDLSIEKKKMILCIGRWSEQKNQGTLLKALKLLGDRYFCVFIGKGEPILPEPDTKVFIYDNIPNKQLPEWYSLCDCFCLPSRWEGFGTVFIEAMACGALVVTSKIAPITEYIQNRYNGFLVENYKNPTEVAEAISYACEYLDENTRSEIRIKAIETAQKFSKQEIDNQEVRIYKSLLK